MFAFWTKKGCLTKSTKIRTQKSLIFVFCHWFSPTAAACGGSGSSNGEDKAGRAEGDAGPSCSSSSKDASDTKSRFFDDSEESEEGEEEEGSDEEVRAGYHNKLLMLVAKAPSLRWLRNTFPLLYF